MHEITAKVSQGLDTESVDLKSEVSVSDEEVK